MYSGGWSFKYARISSLVASAMVRFAFECPNQWGLLRPTPDDAVRFCESCQQEVHLCATAEQVRRHALRGHCVAVRAPLADAACREQTPRMGLCVGRPDPYVFWGEELLSGPRKRWWQFWK